MGHGSNFKFLQNRVEGQISRWDRGADDPIPLQYTVRVPLSEPYKQLKSKLKKSASGILVSGSE
jgi:hypothetical protein